MTTNEIAVVTTQAGIQCEGTVALNGSRCVLDAGHEERGVPCRDWGAGTKWRERERVPPSICVSTQ